MEAFTQFTRWWIATFEKQSILGKIILFGLKVCSSGKACGDSCISKSKTCTKPPGCACNG